MAIDTSDQTTAISGEDGGASLTAPTPDEILEEEEVSTGPATEAAPRAGAQPGKQKGGPSSRAGRRGAFTEVSKQLEEKLTSSWRTEISGLKTEFSRMLDGIRQQGGSQQRQVAPQQQGPDPVTAQLAEIDAARDAEMRLLQARKPGEAFDFTRYRKLENDRTALLARREAQQLLASMGITPQAVQQMRQGGGQRQPFSQEVVYASRFEQLQQEFPYLSDVKVAGQVGAYRRYLKQSGRPDTFETDREAAAHVMAQLGLTTRPVPRGRAEQYAAPGPGERGGGRQAKEVRLPASAVNGLSADEQAMARQFLFGNGEA